MNGNRAILDTNCIIYLLQLGAPVEKRLEQYDWIGISIISRIEFLSYEHLDEKSIALFDSFSRRVEMIALADSADSSLINQIVYLRKKYKLKLPDIIIAATAIASNAELVTADKRMQQIKELKIQLL